MAARGYFADSGGGDTTTQSATVQTDHRTLTFTGDASSTYLILGYCESQVDINAARDTQVRLYDDTAAVSVYDTNFECRLTSGVEWQPLTLAYLFTTTGSPVPQTFKLQHKLESTLTNADSVCRNGSLVALKLISGTDFTATSDSAATATSSPGTWTDYTTSLTFTATSADYLILAVARCAYSATSNGARIRLLCEDTTTGVADTEWVPNDSTTDVTYAAMVKRTLTAGSVTFKLQHSRAVAGSGTSTLDFVRYIALRLSDFDSTQVTQDTGADTTTSATYADLGDTHTQTLTSGIDYLMLASANSTIDTTSVTFGLKVTDGTTTFAEPAVSPGVTGKGFAAVVPKIISGSGSSTTHKVQGISNGTATLTLAEHRIAMLQVEAAAGGDATASPATVALTLAQPAVTLSAGATSSPAVTALTLAQPAVTPSAGASVAPAVTALVLAQPAVTLSAGASVAPAVAALTLAQPAVSLSAGASVAVAVAALTLAQPAVTAGAGATATPAVAALTLAQPAVSLSAGATSSPAVAALVLAQPAVTASGGGSATATPSVAALTLAQPAVTPSAGATVAPAVTALVLSQPAVTAAGGASTSPAAVALIVAVPASTATTGSTVAPAVVALIVAQPAVTPSAGATVTLAVVALIVAVPAVNAGGIVPPDGTGQFDHDRVLFRFAGGFIAARFRNNQPTARFRNNQPTGER